MDKMTGNKKGVILFIDDERICHSLAELIIHNFTNYKMVGAFNGEEAMVLARKHIDDLCLILSDIMLPDESGYDIFNHLKEDPKLALVPFVFQSGLSLKEREIEKHIKENINVISKPYSQAELVSLINELVIRK